MNSTGEMTQFRPVIGSLQLCTVVHQQLALTNFFFSWF